MIVGILSLNIFKWGCYRANFHEAPVYSITLCQEKKGKADTL